MDKKCGINLLSAHLLKPTNNNGFTLTYRRGSHKRNVILILI